MSDTLRAQARACSDIAQSVVAEIEKLKGTREVIRADRANMLRELEKVQGFLDENPAVATGALWTTPPSLRTGIERLDAELERVQTRLEVAESTHLNALTEQAAIEKYLREEQS